MASRDEIADTLAGFAIFADLSTAALQQVAHTFEEAWYPDGARILRQGLTGAGYFIILEGEAGIVHDGERIATLGRGEFFGEPSLLLGESPVADVVALRPMRCLVLPGPALEPFLLAHPSVMYRMLQTVARRMRNAVRSQA